jgi:hypothetical protein
MLGNAFLIIDKTGFFSLHIQATVGKGGIEAKTPK